jgi:hypothetical protein
MDWSTTDLNDFETESGFLTDEDELIWSWDELDEEVDPFE